VNVGDYATLCGDRIVGELTCTPTIKMGCSTYTYVTLPFFLPTLGTLRTKEIVDGMFIRVGGVDWNVFRSFQICLVARDGAWFTKDGHEYLLSMNVPVEGVYEIDMSTFTAYNVTGVKDAMTMTHIKDMISAPRMEEIKSVMYMTGNVKNVPYRPKELDPDDITSKPVVPCHFHYEKKGYEYIHVNYIMSLALGNGSLCSYEDVLLSAKLRGSVVLGPWTVSPVDKNPALVEDVSKIDPIVALYGWVYQCKTDVFGYAARVFSRQEGGTCDWMWVARKIIVVSDTKKRALQLMKGIIREKDEVNDSDGVNEKIEKIAASPEEAFVKEKAILPTKAVFEVRTSPNGGNRKTTLSFFGFDVAFACGDIMWVLGCPHTTTFDRLFGERKMKELGKNVDSVRWSSVPREVKSNRSNAIKVVEPDIEVIDVVKEASVPVQLDVVNWLVTVDKARCASTLANFVEWGISVDTQPRSATDSKNTYSIYTNADMIDIIRELEGVTVKSIPTRPIVREDYYEGDRSVWTDDASW